MATCDSRTRREEETIQVDSSPSKENSYENVNSNDSATTVVALSLLLILSGPTAMGQKQKAKGADEKVFSVHKELIRKPVLTVVQQKLLDSLKLAFKASPCTTPVALSVFGRYHHSAGQDAVLSYDYVNTNEGGAWHSKNTFMAPCNGLYYFSIHFVKDAYYYGGTTDDVSVYLVRNGSGYGAAWAGEGGGMRETGADGVILRLTAGDAIQTGVHSDGNPMRHLIYYSFNAYRIGD